MLILILMFTLTGATLGVLATGITVSAHGASTVVVHPHAGSEYVTVVVDRDLGTAVAAQEEVWWQPQDSSQ